VAVGEDHRGELRVHVELVQDALDVIADGHRRDEELLADGGAGGPAREATENLLLSGGEFDRLPFVGRERPKRLAGVGLSRQLALEARGPLL
jgi:hypothetical protein